MKKLLFLALLAVPCAAQVNVSGSSINISSTSSSGAATLETNSVANTSQTVLNFTDTPTVKFTNPSGGVQSATVPDASNSSLGVAQCDGTTTTCSSGVVTVPTATTSTLGVAKANGTDTTITAGAVGAIGLNGAGTPASAKVLGTNASKQLAAASASDILSVLSGSSPWQASFTFLGVLANSQIMLLVPSTIAVTIPSGCAGSYMGATVAATGSTAITINKLAGGPTGASTTLCTATFAASPAVTATFAGTGGSLAAGDYLEVLGPVSANATLANIGGGIYGTH